MSHIKELQWIRIQKPPSLLPLPTTLKEMVLTGCICDTWLWMMHYGWLSNSLVASKRQIVKKVTPKALCEHPKSKICSSELSTINFISKEEKNRLFSCHDVILGHANGLLSLLRSYAFVHFNSLQIRIKDLGTAGKSTSQRNINSRVDRVYLTWMSRKCF